MFSIASPEVVANSTRKDGQWCSRVVLADDHPFSSSLSMYSSSLGLGFIFYLWAHQWRICDDNGCLASAQQLLCVAGATLTSLGSSGNWIGLGPKEMIVLGGDIDRMLACASNK